MRNDCQKTFEEYATKQGLVLRAGAGGYTYDSINTERIYNGFCAAWELLNRKADLSVKDINDYLLSESTDLGFEHDVTGISGIDESSIQYVARRLHSRIYGRWEV